MEGVKKFGKELFDTTRGRGEDVKFRKEVEQYCKDHSGIKEKEAQKILLDKRLEDLSEEIRLSRTLKTDSKVYRRFFGALREVCGDVLLAKIREEANKAGGSWVAPPLSRVFPGHIQAKKNELKTDLVKKYKTVPQEKIEDILTASPTALKDMIDTTGLIGKLADRFRGDATISASTDLARTFRRSPQTMVDLGKILQAQESLSRHIRGLEKQVHWERTRADMQKWGKAVLMGTFKIISVSLRETTRALLGIVNGVFGLGSRGGKKLLREVDKTVLRAFWGPDAWKEKKKDKDKDH